jgi:hypothetical protein
MGSYDPPVWSYYRSALWDALKEAGAGIRRRLMEHVRTVLATIVAATVAPPLLRLLPAFSTARVVEKLKDDFWENALITIATLLVILFMLALTELLRAPYAVHQRTVGRHNAVIVESWQRATAHQLLQDEIEASNRRLSRLRTALKVQNETFFVWELLTPGDRPIIRNRRFEDCMINGPAVITFVGTLNLERSTLATVTDVEEVMYEVQTHGARQGLVAFLNCDFLRCRFDGIGYYGEKAELDKLRAATRI